MNQERQIPAWLVPELKRRGYDNPRIEQRDGVLYFGTDPWAPCDWCGSVRDTGESHGCPFCLCDTERRDRERWEAIRLEALFASFVPTRVH